MFGDDVTSDDFDIEWDEYRKDCCKEYIESFLECCPDFVESAEYSELVSPAYYNFETDKLYANVVLQEDWREKILSFMETNKDWVAEKIKKDWTSYDGFLSFMDNTYEDWLNRFKTEEDIDPRYLSTMIGYMMLFEDKDVYYFLIDRTMENVFVGGYITCTKDLKTDTESGLTF